MSVVVAMLTDLVFLQHRKRENFSAITPQTAKVSPKIDLH